MLRRASWESRTSLISARPAWEEEVGALHAPLRDVDGLGLDLDALPEFQQIAEAVANFQLDLVLQFLNAADRPLQSR